MPKTVRFSPVRTLFASQRRTTSRNAQCLSARRTPSDNSASVLELWEKPSTSREWLTVFMNYKASHLQKHFSVPHEKIVSKCPPAGLFSLSRTRSLIIGHLLTAVRWRHWDHPLHGNTGYLTRNAKRVETCPAYGEDEAKLRLRKTIAQVEQGLSKKRLVASDTKSTH